MKLWVNNLIKWANACNSKWIIIMKWVHNVIFYDIDTRINGCRAKFSAKWQRNIDDFSRREPAHGDPKKKARSLGS